MAFRVQAKSPWLGVGADTPRAAPEGRRVREGWKASLREDKRLIDRATPAQSPAAPTVECAYVAPVMRRQVRGHVSRQGLGQPRPHLIERSRSPDLSRHSAVAVIREDDASRLQARAGGEVHQVQPVVFAEPERGDKELRGRGPQTRSRSREIRAERDFWAIGFQVWLNDTGQGGGGRKIRVDYEHRSQR